MSSIDIGAVHIGASSESSWDGSDSELEIEVTQVVQRGCRIRLWAFWHDNRLKMPAWYDVAKDVALIQLSSAFNFMEGVFSILRACMDESRQELLTVLQRPHCGVGPSQVQHGS